MIEYPIHSLVSAGIRDIILVTGGRHPGRFLELLKNGSKHGIEHLYYTYQEGEGGIADALKLAQPFVTNSESCIVMLGDNYFEETIEDHVWDWENCPGGARVLLKEVPDPERFGVAELDGEDHIVSIEEKPEKPKSSFAVTGCYFFDRHVWDFARQITVSKRNELEIVDILNIYHRLNSLDGFIYEGYWRDMGKFETLHEVANRREDIDNYSR
jgi:glucose-1-phosphate thymidylyltransferase